MKTEDSICNPSVTITMTCDEAMTIWNALAAYDRTHRKTPRKIPLDWIPNTTRKRSPRGDNKWGNYDCPPKIQPLLRAIKSAIQSEQPQLFKTCFGYELELHNGNGVSSPT